LVILCCFPISSRASADEPQINFPVVFTSLDDLAQLGISFDPYPEGREQRVAKPRFPNTCYDYGLETMSPSFISLSDEFIKRYKARGFTRESVCMALVSGARFDPETGRRLPTFVYKDDPEFKQEIRRLDIKTIDVSFYVPTIFASKRALADGLAAFKRGDLDGLSDEQVLSLLSGGIFNEMPLVLPDCFKNGTPYLDCTWRYGLVTGKRMSSARTRSYSSFGEALDRKMRKTIESGAHKEEEARADPYLTIDGYLEGHDSLGLSYNVAPVTFYDVSPAFARGYGYALYASGEKDQGFSAASIRAAFDGARSSSRFGLERLKELLQ
jgi:hypothetical protein